MLPIGCRRAARVNPRAAPGTRGVDYPARGRVPRRAPRRTGCGEGECDETETTPMPPRCPHAPIAAARRLGAALGLVGLAAVAACDDGRREPAVAPARPHVLLVTFDTTRADRIGAYGHPAARTPVWDELASRGVLFERALAPVPLTLPTHASLLTGTYPTEHGIRTNGSFVLDPAASSLAEAFRSAGYATAAFVGSYVLDARFGLDQGFDVYTGPDDAKALGGAAAERSAARVVDDALHWWTRVPHGTPVFAWVHFYDPHFPYAPPPPFDDGDPYDGEIAYADQQLGRLLAGFGDDPLLVAVTSDHGDALGQHGEGTHGNFVYQSTLHVPLVLAGAGLEEQAGTRIERPVSIVGLPATLARLAGLGPGDWPGRRLGDLLQAPAPPAGAGGLYFESYLPWHAHRWRAYRGVVWDAYKWIDAQPPELYHLADDPDELHDLAEREPARAAEGRRRLAALLERHPPRAWSRARRVGPSERERLEALGYVVGAADTGAPDASDDRAFDPALPDPRSHRTDLALQEEIARLVAGARRRGLPGEERQGLLDRAEQLAGEVLARNPDDLAVLERRTEVDMLRGDCGRALPALERLLATPRAGDHLRFDRASCLGRLGRSDQAADEMAAILERNPAALEPARWLFKHHVARREYRRAAGRLRAALATLDPDSGAAARARGLIAWAEQQREGEPPGTDPAEPPGGP